MIAFFTRCVCFIIITNVSALNGGTNAHSFPHYSVFKTKRIDADTASNPSYRTAAHHRRTYFALRFSHSGKTIKKFKAPYGWLCATDGSKPVNIFIVIKPQSVWRECERETPKSFPSNKCRKLCVFSAHNRVATLHPHVWINKRKCFSFG